MKAINCTKMSDFPWIMATVLHVARCTVLFKLKVYMVKLINNLISFIMYLFQKIH